MLIDRVIASFNMPSRMKFLFFLFLILGSLGYSQDSTLVLRPNATGNPLLDYVLELDEMGRAFSGWSQTDSLGDSWLFASHALLVIRNNGINDLEPFPGMVTLVPALWKDLKTLSPRYLVELAGGALATPELMSLTRKTDLKDIQVEERFIMTVAGFSHLRMLHGTIGDSLYQEVLFSAVESAPTAAELSSELIKSVQIHCDPLLAESFAQILKGENWLDLELNVTPAGRDSTHFSIHYGNDLRFPCQLLIVWDSGDSSIVNSADMLEGLVFDHSQLKSLELDPEHILSEYYRFNNKWPRFAGNIHIQPFLGLPDWEYYKVVVSPSSWSDWDGDKRYGLKISAGLGIDLWPAYPSDFRHRMTLEFNTHGPLDDQVAWGSRATYGHPISRPARLFSNISVHNFDDWQGASVGLTKYIGRQTYLIQGSRLTYQRVSLAIERDRYGDPDIWERKQAIDLVRSVYTGLSLNRFGDRIYLRLRGAQGHGPDGAFSLVRTQIDLSGVFWNWLVGGFHFVGGVQSESTPAPYQFTHSYAWQDELSALPNFRGQTKIAETTNGYLGLSVAAGYWFSWMQVKLFGSSMMYDQPNINFVDVKPRYAAGFGFEHKSIFTAGMYFPIWQSNPLEGEKEWQWRYQWRFTWNL